MDQFDQYDFIYKRASFEVYKRFKINKLELWMLSSLNWHLQSINKTVVSKQIFFDTVTGNKREQRKMEGYLLGLIRGQFIGTFEYCSKPGSMAFGLSELGFNVLRCKYEAIKLFQDKYPKSPYRLDSQFPPSIISESLHKYRRTA